jgi:O-antigen/teichoic acid export membrane protein
MTSAGPNRLQRLLGGWSANLTQLILNITQQLALVPIFLHYRSSDMLAGWLALYAAGSLVLVADAGLMSRAVNRFLAFKSCVDCDGRTADFFLRMQGVYLGLIGVLVTAFIAGVLLLRPSHVFGFRAISDFDLSFVIMTAGTVLLLPSNLATALYRARGLYGRAVWIQCAAMVASQLAQIVAIVATGGLAAIVVAFVAPQVLAATYLATFDVRRLFPFVARARIPARRSWHWIIGQFRRAFPFAVAGSTEVALQNLPVLFVSAIVIDRIAVAQWGLTRVVAGLVRGLCTQATLPLAAELGHDRAIGAKDQLRRLYARGSVLVTLLASLVVSGMLAFWQDFFALWTHGAIPFDAPLTLTLLIGAQIVAPAILALGYGYYSDRGNLLARTKGLQLVAFTVLSLALTPSMGPMGTAIAVVATDVAVQFGLLASVIIWDTLERPLRHVAFLAALMIVVAVLGWGLGVAIQSVLPLTEKGLTRFIAECAIWLIVVALAASPLANTRFRNELAGLIPS